MASFSIVLLIIGLLMVLLAAEFFTNGIESLGKAFSLSQAVAGSILAAVGTALPETVLPVVAILWGNGEESMAKDIGVGAILGAPFMLSTIAFFLVGTTVIISYFRKSRAFKLDIEHNTISRDLIFFIVLYSIAIFVPVFTGRKFIAPIAVSLVIGYLFHIYLTVKSESNKIEHFEGLHLYKIHKKIDFSETEFLHKLSTFAQIAVSLLIMVAGAKVFVKGIEHISIAWGMNPLLFSLIIAPIATELPEKFNSVTWIWKGKDSLAVGNITGAMVFQAVFPVSIGLLFTDWNITGLALVSALISLFSAAILLLNLIAKKHVTPLPFLLGGVFYLVYLIVMFMTWQNPN